MLSGYYKNIMNIQYLNYLIDLDSKKDAGLSDNEFYALEKINKDFKGPIKEYTYYSRLKNMISGCASPVELAAKSKKLQPFIAGMNNANYRKSLLNRTIKRMYGQLVAPTDTRNTKTGFCMKKYKNDERIVFLSIAVSDRRRQWKSGA